MIEILQCETCKKVANSTMEAFFCCRKPQSVSCPDLPTQEELIRSLARETTVATDIAAPYKKPSNAQLYPKYFKDVSDVQSLDIYGVCKLFGVNDPSGALQHAIKKLLLSGVRTGGKSNREDIKEARDTLNRYLEMLDEPSTI